MKFQLLRAFVFFSGLFLLISCASVTPNSKTAGGLFEQGEAALKKENYLNALDKFRQVKNRFPYSSKAVEAELKIADTYFAQESFIEAEAAYEIFREMHPTHPKVDYVQFRMGLSFYNQIPSNIARDLTAAHRAIDAFEVLLLKYPSSSYAKEAEDFLKKSRAKLAQHENYVANFYFQREHFLSASYRYASLLKTFPGLGYDEISLFRLGVCYYRIRMFGNSRDALQRLLKDFPNTRFRGKAYALLQDLDKSKAVP